MPKCMVCDEDYKDLNSHITNIHGVSVEKYKEQYPNAKIVDEDIILRRTDKRSEKIDEIKIKTKDAFLKYEGGHPSRDPGVLALRKYNKELFGHKYNLEAYKETNLERYGVEHLSKDPEWVKANTQKIIDRHGSLFGGKQGNTKKEVPSKEEIEEKFKGLRTQERVAAYFSVSVKTLSNWVKEHDLVFSKQETSSRLFLSPYEVVKEYLDSCRRLGKLSSFYEFSKQEGRGGFWKTKLDRLFKPTAKFAHLKAGVSKMVYAKSEEYDSWLKNFE